MTTPFWISLLVLTLIGFSLGAGLVDNPIQGTTVTYLDGRWTAKSDNGLSMSGNVPGDLITDLENAGVIKDPLYETVWRDNSSIWNNHVWTYSTSFNFEASAANREVLLVFDGVKMGAYITLNGNRLGTVADQFLRYYYPVKQFLKATNNLLEVQFPLTNAVDCQGRFMACTGGWDWAPYSNTKDQHGAATLSKGIWKSVYLTTVTTAAIVHVVPLVTYAGSYPTAPLKDKQHAGFNVNVTVHLYSSIATSGTLTVSGQWGPSFSIPVSLTAGESSFSVKLTADADAINLWWPNGLGEQPLYTVDATFSIGTNKVTTSRKIGFRVFALVTADDSDPSKIEGNDGSGTLTMRYKVNGANIWSRGGNMIPMEEYEGRANSDAFRFLVQSAANANFNTFRIWGGGIFLYDIFYDTADALGILMYHDMMYAQGNHDPSPTSMQTAEIQHQVRRLSSHPSIVMWDACNECGGGGVYESFVSPVVAKEDPSRPIWPSCPAAGWSSGVNQLWGTPNGKKLTTRPGNSPFETHGPYQHGSGWPAVNGDRNLELFNPETPPNLPNPVPTGPLAKGVYASEFGCVGWQSFESMNPTVAPSDWSLHSPPMYQRNYPCDNIIQVYFGPQTYPAGEQPFKKQMYQCLIGQALELKSDIETRRSTNEWGTVIWQLNEVWPTGGWGTIEYGTPGYTKGQVVGGRWKPAHYNYKSSVFTDVTSTCGSNGHCYVKNDGINQFVGKVQVSLVDFQSGKSTQVNEQNLTLAAGAGTIDWYCAMNNAKGACATWPEVFSKAGCTNQGKDCILTVVVTGSGGTVVSNNVVALQQPGNFNLKQAEVKFTVTQDGNGGANIVVTTDNLAAYVVLTTEASGVFSDNAFLLPPGSKLIKFHPFGKLDMNLLTSTLRVEHVKTYQ